MISSTKSYIITEYGGFVRGEQSLGDYQGLEKNIFDDLELFILANNSKTDTEAVDLLALSAQRGGRKIITAKNYVGVITMKDGTVIEILPKIYGNISKTDGKDETEITKDIFLEMLRTLKDTPFKDFNASNLKTDRMNILEIFIEMFASEVNVLVKQGLKSCYNTVESNERFYIRYDEWSVNRPENRLLKATLRFLLKRTKYDRNRLSISHLLMFFDGVDISTDYDTDFSKCANDRGTSHYQKALSWCKIFLRGNSFTAFAGSEVATALLFPMEKIFESYVAAKLRKVVVTSGIELLTQDGRYCLFDRPEKKFKLRPDIVLAKGDDIIAVMDTKWKILSDKKSNYGISQDDMYQMYAYGKKYRAKKVILLYPQPESLRETNISFSSGDKVDEVNVEVSFVDLLDLLRSDKSVKVIMDKALGQMI
jgi:5-methylcytosine-specific restriction enzyme subunit McrC